MMIDRYELKAAAGYVAYVGAVTAFISLALIAWANAHEAPSGWDYPTYCCGGHDCGPISPARVRPEGEGGYVVDGKFHVIRKDVQDSPDGQYHACFPTSERMACFWAPLAGM
ncbi:MAG: hypothetical protein JWN58_1006 [Gammaproteobacteria bacterium]|nr:hypothetical protein [Gammaproteobacteria bacterium]